MAMKCSIRLVVFSITCCLIEFGFSASHAECRADEPLHVRIDRLVDAQLGDWKVHSPSSDAEFVRRIYLDLAGRIPTTEETRQFLANAAADKRLTLIDQLLGGTEYPRRMHELFHAMLMERRGEHEEWSKFLRTAFEQNMPWDEMARAIIKPDADDEATRGAAYFLTARLIKEGAMAPVDVPGLTRDVGRLLAGVDLQCAQCHDHISIDDYLQRDFQGLHMIFENVQTRRDVKFPAVAEKVLIKKQDFMSVFTQEPMQTAPRVPGGQEIEIVSFTKGEEFAVPPDTKTRTPGVPKFSPLGELASRLTTAENPLFSKNIANRLWFMMMGRGLVEPLDLQHGQNPPTHPELLELIAAEFAAHDFDIKWLLRELALSATYQRTCVLPDGQDEPPLASYALGNQKRLSAEQLFWTTMTAIGEIDRQRQQLVETAKTEGKPEEEVQAAAHFTAEQVLAKSADLTELHKRFLKAFASPPKKPEVEFEPTVKAALFIMHDENVLALLQQRPGNLTDRLMSIEPVEKLADELFLSILSRLPNDEDRQDVVQHLAANQDRRAEAIAELAWALLASTEFILNH